LFITPDINVLSLTVSRFVLGRTSIAAGHKVKGDHNAKERLRPTLAPDEVRHRTARYAAHCYSAARLLLLLYTRCFCVFLCGYVQHRCARQLVATIPALGVPRCFERSSQYVASLPLL
jgi:hypothetical protein